MVLLPHTSRRGSGVLMDQALERAYKKPANDQGGITGISRRKQAVCKWNIIKHEKAKFKTFLHEWSCLNDDEYAAHHESFQSITKQDEKCVRAMTDYISQQGNPFTTLSSQPITNIVTNKQLNVESNTFLLQYIKLGETAYCHFNKHRLMEKTLKLFDKNGEQ